VERFHRRLKDALRARAAGVDWYQHLPCVMLGIRSAWREGAEFTPAEAVYGAQPVLPGQFLAAPESPSPSFLADLQGVLTGRQPLPASHHSLPAPTVLPAELLASRFVFVRRDGVQPPLAPRYDGPYLVLKRSLHTFRLQIGDREDVVSVLRLKPCHSPPDVAVALPPRRGRPPSAVPVFPATSGSIKPSGPRRVRFRCAPVLIEPSSPSSTSPPDEAAGMDRPRRQARLPARYR